MYVQQRNPIPRMVCLTIFYYLKLYSDVSKDIIDENDKYHCTPI